MQKSHARFLFLQIKGHYIVQKTNKIKIYILTTKYRPNRCISNEYAFNAIYDLYYYQSTTVYTINNINEHNKFHL